MAKRVLRIYTWRGGFWDAASEAATRFTNETGISTQLVEEKSSQEALDNIGNTWPNPPADAWFATSIQALMADARGYVEPLVPSLTPNLNEIPPNRLLKNHSGVTVGAPFGITAVVLAYRPDYVQTPPRDLADLLLPTLAKRVAVPMTWWLGGKMLIQMALARGGNENNIQPAFQFLKELAPRIGMVVTEDSSHQSEFAKASIWVSQTGLHTPIFLEKKGVPVATVARFGDSPTVMSADNLVVLKGANSDLASQFVNWLLNRRNNEEFNSGNGYLPSNPKSRRARNLDRHFLTDSEIEEVGYWPDSNPIVKNLANWTNQWTTEIAPLIKQ